MARVAVRESVTLAGRAERARAARTFVGEVLGPGHPCGDVAVLLVNEMDPSVFYLAVSRVSPGMFVWFARSPRGGCNPVGVAASRATRHLSA
jgi:hypothetical protein